MARPVSPTLSPILPHCSHQVGFRTTGHSRPLARLFCGRAALLTAPNQARCLHWGLLCLSEMRLEFLKCTALSDLKWVYTLVFTKDITNLLKFTHGFLHNLISPCLVCTLHLWLIMARRYLQPWKVGQSFCSFSGLLSHITNLIQWSKYFLCLSVVMSLEAVVCLFFFKVMSVFA